MKGKIEKLTSVLTTLSVLAAPYLALAFTEGGLGAGPQTVSDLGTIVCKAIGWIFTFLIITAIIFVLIAAFKYLTAAGDPEKVKSASHTLIYAAVAVAVALLAKGIPVIVGTITTGSTIAKC